MDSDNIIDKTYAEIAVDAPLEGTFTYIVPQEMINALHPGMQVRVPFGRRTITGYVIETNAAPLEKAKAIKEINSEHIFFTKDLLSLLKKTAAYYHHPLGKVLTTALPNSVSTAKQKVRTELYYSLKPTAPIPRGARQQEIFELLKTKNQPLARSEIQLFFPTCAQALKRMLELEIIISEERRVERDPLLSRDIEPSQPLELNSEQSTAFAHIKAAIDKEQFRGMLLFGITGSGKTEVYLQSISHCLELGKRALVLVPEIALTPQLIDRFQSRFQQQGAIRVLHSGLNDGERLDSWQAIERGEVDIVIGVRSAIFAPISNLGIIVIDEEHEPTYKQGDGLRYHARDLALLRGQIASIPVVMGSATPSFTTFQRALTGEIDLLELNNRATRQNLPTVKLVDMREVVRHQGISKRLIFAITERLEKNEQTILLLNRRGFSPFILCNDCGHVIRCPNCEISLTFFQQSKQLRCSYCSLEMQPPNACPSCDSVEIIPCGAGTERLEETLVELFPDAKIARMDSDTTRKKGSIQALVDGMMDGSFDILIGTQMIAKGHDFAGVTLCGVLDADSALNFPDFRSSERSFALLSQTAGRAGRGERAGEVFIQTRNPEHTALVHSIKHSFKDFFQTERKDREALGYPPFGFLTNIIFQGNDEKRVTSAASIIADTAIAIQTEVEVLGPAPCPLSRLRGKHRGQLLLKARQLNQLHHLIAQIKQTRRALPGGVTMTIDVDPIDML